MSNVKRYSQLRAALLLSGESVGDFAKRLSVTRIMVFDVAMGNRQSEKISSAIDSYIAENLIDPVLESANAA